MALVRSSSQVTGTGTAATITTPAGAAAGDILIVGLNHDAADGVWSSTGSVFTQLRNEAYQTSSTIGLYYLVLAGAPAASYQFDYSGSSNEYEVAAVALDPDGDTYASIAASTVFSNSASATCTSNALAGSADPTIMFGLFTTDDTNTVGTPPPDMDAAQFVNGAGSDLASYTQVNPGTGSLTRAIVWTTSSGEKAAIIAIAVFTATAGPTIDTQPTAQTCTINNSSDTTATFTVAATTSGGALSYQWQFEDSAGAGTYTNITNGGIYSGATTTSVTFTPTTKTGITGRRVRCNVTDSNGTTTTDAVMLTIYTGFQFTSSTNAVTNGSGVATVTWTDDRAGSVLGNGGFVKGTATYSSGASRTSQRPT